MTSLFIFRRDLRLDDNTALIRALNDSDEVIPCFVLDPRQLTKSNEYRSLNAIQFLFESLRELNSELLTHDSSLYLFRGKSEQVISHLLDHVDAVYLNRDYTPFSIERDAFIEKSCIDADKKCVICDDLLLSRPEDIFTKSGGKYQIFTPFYKNVIQKDIPIPDQYSGTNYSKIDMDTLSIDELKINNNKNIFIEGGRKNAIQILDDLTPFKNYSNERNFPALSRTTGLSAHNKFGTLSVRELYHAIKNCFGKEHALITQLIWRDFYTHIAFHHPHVFGNNFREKYNQIEWSDDLENFKNWCNGSTGFPIVDAGMRQLNVTGWMHNRVRMIVSSFLTKSLRINWQRGEKYFAQNLIDYDPCVNNGSWQWAASTGCDAQPYFRIFNPWRQQENFDRECIYIKKWVPELRGYTPAEIHNWCGDANYPKPMIDHKSEARITLGLFKSVS